MDHDLRAVQAFYTRFYRLAWLYSGLHVDSEQVAAVDYNVAHREMGRPPKRAPQANTAVDRITSGTSVNPASDWALIHADLRRCYRSPVARYRLHELNKSRNVERIAGGTFRTSDWPS